ncbi:hypothetical protein P3S67_021165 [Capsicum chacoense]
MDNSVQLTFYFRNPPLGLSFCVLLCHIVMVFEFNIIILKETIVPHIVICFLEVGFSIMSHILSTKNNNVLSCLMTLLVINLEEKTQNFRIGDGALMIVIFQVFNRKALLNELKGKRVVFVRDSLNKPLEYSSSIVCLIESTGIPSLKPLSYKGNLITFEVKKWGSFNRSGAIYKKVGMKLRRYEMALRTWSDWLEAQTDRNRTRLFFMSLSPSHKKYHLDYITWAGNATDWGMRNVQTCYDETEPILRKEYWGSQKRIEK